MHWDQVLRATASSALVAVLGLIVFAASAATLRADDLQTWSDLNYTVARSGRFEWDVGGTLRFAETAGELYDRRAGTKFEYQAIRGLRIGVGYTFRRRRFETGSGTENRVTAGASYKLLRRAAEVKGTTLYERHIIGSARSFNRYRQRFELSVPGKVWSPWLYQDFAFRHGAGFVRSRSRVGLQWAGAQASLKVGYQFESIRAGTAWAPRHAIHTEVSFDRPVWRLE